MLLLRAHGARCGGLGALLVPLGPLLGRSWALLGALEALLVLSWQVFGAFWGPSWDQTLHFLLENVVSHEKSLSQK